MSEATRNDWVVQSLGELAEARRGITYSSAMLESQEEGLPYVNMKSFLKGGGFNSDGTKRYAGIYDQNDLVGERDLLIANIDVTAGDIVGVPALLPNELSANKALYSHHVTRLRLTSKVTVPFLYYLLCLPEYRSHMLRIARGTTVLMLDMQAIKRIPICAPNSKAEQDRIAEILSTLDEAIEQTEALIAKHQQIKAGLMHDLFTRGVTSDGHLRPTRESQYTRFGWIPKAWRIGSLLDVADATRQPILTGPFGADLGSDDFVADGVPVLRIGNVQQGRLDFTDLLYVTEAKARELKRYSVKEGDLLFARQGATTGRNALANQEADGWLINYHIIRVALDHSRCAPIFIEAAFAGEIVKRQVERDKGRGTREGINTAQLKALQIPLASVSEQNTIAQILMTHESQCAEMQCYLAKLYKQKHGLMHDLLTGRVRVLPHPGPLPAGEGENREEPAHA